MKTETDRKRAPSWCRCTRFQTQHTEMTSFRSTSFLSHLPKRALFRQEETARTQRTERVCAEAQDTEGISLPFSGLFLSPSLPFTSTKPSISSGKAVRTCTPVTLA